MVCQSYPRQAEDEELVFFSEAWGSKLLDPEDAPPPSDKQNCVSNASVMLLNYCEDVLSGAHFCCRPVPN